MCSEYVWGPTSRQHIPSDGVCDGCEDPVELSEGGASVVEPSRDPAPNTKQMALCQPRSLYVTALTQNNKEATAQ